MVNVNRQVCCGYCDRPGATPGYVDDWGVGHMPNCEALECLVCDVRDVYRQKVERALHDGLYMIEVEDGELG